MGVLLAFAVGYVVGARAGHDGYDEVVASLKAVRDSSEFQALIAALREHAGYVLQEVGSKIAAPGESAAGFNAQDVLERVRSLIRPDGTTSPAS